MADKSDKEAVQEKLDAAAEKMNGQGGASQDDAIREELRKRLSTPMTQEEAAQRLAEIRFRSAQLSLMRNNLTAELNRIDSELALMECETAEVGIRVLLPQGESK